MARTTLLQRTIDENRGRAGCWIYPGYRTAQGYGQAWHKGHREYAHRAIYEIMIGPIPEGYELDHFVCDNGPGGCCNPFHCRPVTHRENMLRSNGMAARNAAITHCRRGHKYSPENTYISREGQRRCVQCNRDRSLAVYYAKRASGEIVVRPDYWTHCKRGHPKEPGHRGCRQCSRDWHKEYKARLRSHAP
jgi:hypothetical protein